MHYVWDFAILGKYSHLFWLGLSWTIAYTIGTIVLGTLLGLVVGMLRVARLPVVDWFLVAYIELFRCTPLLVQIIWFYYAFPVVLGVLSLGCGLLVRRAAGIELPQSLLLPLGFAAVSVVGLIPVVLGSTAPLATPVVVTLAVLGIGLSLPARIRVRGWWLVAMLGVFVVFAAPFVLSGGATFGGYIKLDDTATYLAMLDRAS